MASSYAEVHIARIYPVPFAVRNRDKERNDAKHQDYQPDYK